MASVSRSARSYAYLYTVGCDTFLSANGELAERARQRVEGGWKGGSVYTRAPGQVKRRATRSERVEEGSKMDRSRRGSCARKSSLEGVMFLEKCRSKLCNWFHQPFDFQPYEGRGFINIRILAKVKRETRGESRSSFFLFFFFFFWRKKNDGRILREPREDGRIKVSFKRKTRVEANNFDSTWKDFSVSWSRPKYPWQQF